MKCYKRNRVMILSVGTYFGLCLLGSPVIGGCPAGCPGDFCGIDKQPGMNASLSKATVSIQQQPQNPAGSSTWTASNWATHLNVEVRVVDYDTVMTAHFARVNCGCVEQQTSATQADEDFNVSWSFVGDAVDLTAPGAYFLTATVTDPEGNTCNTAATDDPVQLICAVSVTPAQQGSETPMTTASRSSGVAPLAVFFDAVDTASPAWSSGVAQPADGNYTSFAYQWDFGDTASGIWPTTGQSRNKAGGFEAAHVFETPGTYTVTLVVTDNHGQQYRYQQKITVSAFAGRTYYVSSSGGSDANDGLSPGGAFQTFEKAVSYLQPYTRLLFKRGDTWLLARGYNNSSVDGPVFLADYGDAPQKPTFVAGSTIASDAVLQTNRSDWRFINLQIIGNWRGDSAGASPGILTDQSEHALVARCDVTQTGQMGFGLSYSNANTIYESTATDCQTMGLYCERTARAAVLGSYIHHTTHSHNIYSNSLQKAVFANNKLEKAGNGRHNLRVCAEYTSIGFATHHVVISQNVVKSGSWLAMHIGNNVSSKTQQQSNILIERNRIAEAANQAIAVEAGVNHLAIVNNVISEMGQVMINRNTTTSDPDPMNITIANNTLLNSDTEAVVKVNTSGHRNIVIRNNIIQNYTGDIRSWTAICIWVVDPSGLAEVFSDYNLFSMSARTPRVNRTGNGAWRDYTFAEWQTLGQDAHSINADPQYVDLSNSDFHLRATSPAKDAGIGMSIILSDYDGIARPQGPAPDMGAFEYH